MPRSVPLRLSYSLYSLLLLLLLLLLLPLLLVYFWLLFKRPIFQKLLQVWPSPHTSENAGATFLQIKCPSCLPTNSVKALKGKRVLTPPRADSVTRAPCGLWVERIDPLRFLAGCRKRRLMSCLCLLSLSPGSFECFCVVH